MLADELAKNLTCRIEREVPLAPLSTMGVGGRVECFLEPSCVEDFQSLFAMRAEKGFPLYILGGGSNTVFADGLIPGVLLSTRRWNGICWHEAEDDMINVEVQAGCSLPFLVHEAARRGLGGLEFATGIPGTVGGAIAGNAGAGGQGVGDRLAELTTLEPDGTLRRWKRGEFSYAYRSFPLADEECFFSFCVMDMRACPREEIEAEMKRFRSARGLQPQGERCAGCTFKNPAEPGKPAGSLLDQCGCKGMTVGDAVVSNRHANFILNRGQAAAGDVVKLMRACQERVFEQTGVWLEPEVKFLGFGQDAPDELVGEKLVPCAS